MSVFNTCKDIASNIFEILTERFVSDYRVEEILNNAKKSIDSRTLNYTQIKRSIGVGFDQVTCKLRPNLSDVQYYTLGACLLYGGEKFLNRLKEYFRNDVIEALVTELSSQVNFTEVALQDSLSRFSYPGKLQVVGKVTNLEDD